MEFEIGRGALGGIIATIVMTILMYMGSVMGMKMDMPMMLGTMLFPRGKAAWATGLMLHLMMGGAFFLVYAAIFNSLTIESGIIAWSALFGAVHGLVTGAAMGMMPVLHPRMAAAPGPAPDTLPGARFLWHQDGDDGPDGDCRGTRNLWAGGGSYLRRLGAAQGGL